MKILALFLCCVCVIGCASYSDDEVQGVFPTDPTGEESQTVDETTQSTQQESSVESLPEFHDEFITGELSQSGSETDRLRINETIKYYYYTLNLRLDDAICINIVPKEAVLGYSVQRGGKPEREVQIEDGDLLVVKLDHLIKPGTWKGVLVKNLTRNISF